jgi:hypothetical protein
MSQDPDKSQLSEQTNDPKDGKLLEGKPLWLRVTLQSDGGVDVDLTDGLIVHRQSYKYYIPTYGSLESEYCGIVSRAQSGYRESSLFLNFFRRYLRMTT